MHHHYRDIRDRIAEPPKWWDESAVPRWSDFAPNEGANIYAEEIALLRIRCQNCGHEFDVAMSTCAMDRAFKRPSLEAMIRDGSIHYGDPPNAGCCPSGPTMNSEPVRVLQFWRRKGWDPERVPELEIDFPEERD